MRTDIFRSGICGARFTASIKSFIVDREEDVSLTREKGECEKEGGENVDKFSLIIPDEPTKMPLRRSTVCEKLALVVNLSTIVALRAATKCFDSVNAKLVCKLVHMDVEGTRTLLLLCAF